MATILQFPSAVSKQEPVEEIFPQELIDRVLTFVKFHPYAIPEDVAKHLDMELCETLLVLMYLVNNGSLKMIQNF